VAIIGASGFIGSHLTERLIREGAEVLALIRGFSRVGNLASASADCALAVCDICDRDQIVGLMRRFKPDIVYHLAGHPDAGESMAHIAECMRVNGVGAANVLEAARDCGSRLLVYGDSTKVYGNGPVPHRCDAPVQPICSYAIVKAAAWQLYTLATSFSDLKVVGLRPTFIYGPRQNHNVIAYARECAIAGRPIRLQGGSITRDPLYIDDAIDAFVAAAVTPEAWGHSIPIGGGHELTVSSLCAAVLTAMNASAPIVPGAEKERATEIWRSYCDNSEAGRLLDWRPRTSLADGLARTVAAWARGSARPSSASRTRHARNAEHGRVFTFNAAPNLTFTVLDRRSPGTSDRRLLPRGGRRADDAVPILDSTPHEATRVVGRGVPVNESADTRVHR
jgi:nucleoside-diphosphate-sugar epimerase